MSGRPILQLVSVRPTTAHRIAIEVEAFGYGFDVRVLPPPMGVGHDREFLSIGDARSYAGTLSRATGWPVVDHAGGNEAA